MRTADQGRRGRTLALWVGLAMTGLLPMVGCQAEHAGMTLPSGKFLKDDVQPTPAGTGSPLANTQAATQRARMRTGARPRRGHPQRPQPDAGLMTLGGGSR